MACPNKNHPSWKKLVAKVGEYEAMSLFMRNGDRTPNIGRDLKIPKSGIVSYQQKINILSRLKKYNTRLGTRHTLKFVPTGENYEGKREYTYVVSIQPNFNRNLGNQMSMFQDVADKAEERNERIEDKMRVFLQTIGVEYMTVNEINDREGNPLGFAAKADMLNKVVEVVEDRAGVDTLPEEAAHFFVNILEAQGDPLYTSLWQNIPKYKVYDEVVGNPNYEKYSDDQLRKEAIGKAIAKHIINKDTDNELSDNLSRLERWWIKIMNKIRKFFNKSINDPYAKAALSILNNEVRQNAADLITEEQIQLGDYYQDAPKDKQKNIIDLLNETEEDLVQKLRDNNELQESTKALIDLPPGGQTARYFSKSRNTFVQGRVSDMYQEKLIKKRGKEWMRDVNQRPVNEHKRNQGTFHHSTMQNLVDFWAGNMPQTEANAKRIEDAARISPEGQTIMTKEQFLILSENVKQIVKEIKDQQKEINKDGKVIIKSEAMVYAPSEARNLYYEDTAGTVDLVAVFSDGSASIYDWKFISPSQTAGYGQKRMLRESPYGSKEDGYNMQIGAYKSILKHFYGVNKLRKTRIVPVHVQYKWAGMAGEKVITPVIDTLRMAFDVEMEAGQKVLVDGDPLLQQIPVADELTDIKGLDKILEQKLQQRAVLKAKLEAAKDENKKQPLRLRLDKLDNTIKDIQRKGDFYNVFAGANETVKELQERLPIDDKDDPNYIQIEELLDYLNDISTASLLIGDSAEYLENLQDAELKDRLEKAIDRHARRIEQTYDQLRRYLALRVEELGDAQGIANNTRAQREFGFLKWFEGSSNSTHPIFQTARSYVEQANHKARLQEKQTAEEIQDYIKDIKENSGMSLQDAYDSMINPETGNLHPRIKKDFWDRKQKAIEENDDSWMKRHYKLRDDAQKRYEDRKKRAFSFIDKNFPDYEALYEGEKRISPRKSQKQLRDIRKAAWEAANNIKRPSMWTGKNAHIYTELREEILEDNYSEEYKTIRNNAPLLSFYEYYMKKNKEFSELTNMRFGDNFVANIHQDIIDSISENGWGSSAMLKKALDGLKVRQDEITPENIDENGNLIKTVPILYTTPGTLVDPITGEIDIRLKSKDLGKSLHLMAREVYNYSERTKIEAINLALLAYLQDDKTAILPTDSTGNLLTNKAGKIAKKIAPSDAADFFERMYLNHAVYGQTIQSKDTVLFGEYSMNKTLRQLQTWYSANALGFAFAPALAAGTVGKVSTWIESKKGTSFNSEQFKEAEKDRIKNRKKYEAINNYFEIWQEDMGMRRSVELSAGKIARYVNLDTLFYPFRKADNVLDNTVLNAMMRNFGVNEDGMPKRLEVLPEGSKSLYDLWEVDEINGTVYTGLSEAGEIRFREMVQYTTGSIKGSMRSDDIMPVDTTMIGKLIMQFKGWAPRLLQERFGSFRYTPKMDTYEMGRYKVAASELMAEKDLEDKFVTIAKTFGKWAAETATFGLYKGIKMNEKNAEKEYHKYKMENPDNPDIQNMTMSEYFSMKRAQLRAMGAELKALLGFTIAVLALAREGDDGEPVYTKTWATRKLQMILMKAQLELGFALNPSDWTQVFRSPIPLTGLAVELQKALRNFMQESNDLIMGEDNRRDKSPYGYYTFRLLPGFRQLDRVFEFYEQAKRNPYDQPSR